MFLPPELMIVTAKHVENYQLYVCKLHALVGGKKFNFKLCVYLCYNFFYISFNMIMDCSRFQKKRKWTSCNPTILNYENK